jgi:glycosyltransferase involved in cell wall biosynthesis
MQEPLVSVHMLTYNHEPFIRRAIDGVLSQKTGFPFELVIGEDCSTDDTRHIVLEYQEKYPEIIHVVASDENVGAKKNGYRTNLACRGKYIAYCEGDDFWQRDDKLQIQVDYLESHPECGLVHSDQDRYYAETGKKIKSFFRRTKNMPPEPLNVFRGWGVFNILTCTVMARTKMIQSIAADSPFYLDERHVGGTDITMFIEISLLSKIHYIDDSLATYTVQVESASNTRNQLKKVCFVKSNIESYLYLAEKYDQEEEEKHLRKKLNRMCLWVGFWKKDPSFAKEVMQNDPHFSFKAWVLYVGAASRVVHMALRSILKVSYKWKSRSDNGLKKHLMD